MIKELVATLLLSGSIGAKTQRIETPKKALNGDTYLVSGAYNFRNTISYNSDDYSHELQTITFEEIVVGEPYLQLCPIHWSGETDNIWFVSTLNIVCYLSGSLELTFNLYNYSGTRTLIYEFEDGDSLSDFSYTNGDLIFYSRQQIYLHGDVAKLFDVVFTSQDNVYTKTYTGYYNFNNGLTSVPNRFVTFGHILFNQRGYDMMFTYGDGVHTQLTQAIYLGYYAVFDSDTSMVYEGYATESLTLPFNKTYIASQNAYFTGVKMSQLTYNRLSAYGVFEYVRDTTYDDATFKDLLFGIVDSPIYFVSSILSFELFGVNLFIALTGLLTIICILTLVKKFW